MAERLLLGPQRGVKSICLVRWDLAQLWGTCTFHAVLTAAHLGLLWYPKFQNVEETDGGRSRAIASSLATGEGRAE